MIQNTFSLCALAVKMYKCAQSYSLRTAYTSIKMLGMLGRDRIPNINRSFIVIHLSIKLYLLPILICAVIKLTWFFVLLFSFL